MKTSLRCIALLLVVLLVFSGCARADRDPEVEFMASDTGVSLPEEEPTEAVEVPQETPSTEVPEEQETLVTETEETPAEEITAEETTSEENAAETEWEWPEFMGEDPDVADYTTLEEIYAELESEDYIVFRGAEDDSEMKYDIVRPSKINVLEVYHGDVQVGDVVEWQLVGRIDRIHDDYAHIYPAEGSCLLSSKYEYFLIAKVLERDGNRLVCETAVDWFSFTELSKSSYKHIKQLEQKGAIPPLYQFRLHILETYAPEVCVLDTE